MVPCIRRREQGNTEVEGINRNGLSTLTAASPDSPQQTNLNLSLQPPHPNLRYDIQSTRWCCYFRRCCCGSCPVLRRRSVTRTRDHCLAADRLSSRTATYYEPDGGLGACGAPLLNSDFIVALSADQYADGANCWRQIGVNCEE